MHEWHAQVLLVYRTFMTVVIYKFFSNYGIHVHISREGAQRHVRILVKTVLYFGRCKLTSPTAVSLCHTSSSGIVAGLKCEAAKRCL